MSLKRLGLYSAMGERSSMGWIPVVFGLYSLKRIAMSTPSPAMYSSRHEGTRVPSSSYRSERGTSSPPKCSAHSIQEDFSVGRRAACTCASITGTPSSITSLLWRVLRPQRRTLRGFYRVCSMYRSRRAWYSRAAEEIHFDELPSSSFLTSAGAPAARTAGGISPSSFTTLPAAGMARLPMRARLRTMLPMPTSASSSITHPSSTERCPTVTFRSTSVGRSSLVCSTHLSWMLLPVPTTILSKSPLRTAPNQTLAPSSSTTSPMSTAVGATKASGAIQGSLPSKERKCATAVHRPPKRVRPVAGAVRLSETVQHLAGAYPLPTPARAA